ncbi:MAG: polysaccharide biosynthesis protein [Deferrisomatales bacterium]
MEMLSARGRRALLVLVKVAVIAGSLWLAFLARFDFDVPAAYRASFLGLLGPVVAIKVAVFWRLGTLTGGWRHASVGDVIGLVRANVVASVAVTAYAVFVLRLEGVPRSVLLLDGFFCFVLGGGVRLFTRAVRESYLPAWPGSRSHHQRVLVVGAGAVGQTIVREIRQTPRLRTSVVGFVDDDPERWGKAFQGVRVLGPDRDLGVLCARHRIDAVVIAYSASRRALRELVEQCHRAGVRSKILPAMGDILEGRVSVEHLRDVQLEDLLGREPVRLDLAGIEGYLKGKRVLVTGAGGSIGSELARQVAGFGPGQIVLFDQAETPLFHIERELAASFPGVAVAAVLGDVRDRERVEATFRAEGPQVVFHAAAYKHVPMAERNPAETARTNVGGTRIVAEAAEAAGVERFVMISTDKAVWPSSVMGATKRVAELCVQALAARGRTRFVTVRFGNVLGSNGSVVPIFREQIRAGGPVTVTHPEVTRYFMTIPEACQLVLQAGSMGQGGELFLLEMGEPVRIAELAEQMIRLSGLRPHEDVEISYVGLRPGEKLHEELLFAAEGVRPTGHEKIRVVRSDVAGPADLDAGVEALLEGARRGDGAGVGRLLRALVPEYGDPGPLAPGRGPAENTASPPLTGPGAAGSIWPTAQGAPISG